MLKLIPLWVWAVVALVIALAGGLILQTLRLADARTAHAQYVSGIANEASKAQEDARAEESRRQAAIDQVQTDAQDHIQTAAADAALARDAADSLQRKVNQLLAGRSAQNSELARRGATIRDLSAVLADVLQRADKTAGELAAIADASRIAGNACVASYEALANQ